MKHVIQRAAVTVAILSCALFPAAVFANSSWVWISEKRPYDLLPFVIAGTLIIEIAVIYRIPKMKKMSKVCGLVILANLLSFAVPYLLRIPSGVGYSFVENLDAFPSYTVNILFLIMTLAVEVPFLYKFLRKDTEKEKTLLLTLIVVNVLTTIGVAVVERIFCYGSW
ncbi:MAG: hypothetical protein HFE75_02075 [Firmicutes bacterium]|nr:hypothetical protein [Bacillota bacterium]NBI62903.1 hypothetical protein [Clostridiales bacterium]